MTPCNGRGGQCARITYSTINYLKLNAATRAQRDGAQGDYYETRHDEDDNPMQQQRDKRDDKTERWLRFEMELSLSEKKGTQSRRMKEDVELATDEIINLALYDQADPGNLFLCTIDDNKFEKLKNK